MKKEILGFLKRQDIEYRENFSLSEISSVRIGGEADFLAYPNTEQKLIELVKFLRNNKIKHKTLGRMSNVLPPDEKYGGVIIRTDKLCRYEISENLLTVSSGVVLPFLAKKLSDIGLGGFEMLSGIPGSIGGSVIGNAGAFGGEISDFLLSVKAYDAKSDRTVFLNKEDCDFGYRSSLLKRESLILLSADFMLPNVDTQILKSRIRDFAQTRKNTQPVGLPSVGSTFKRPSEKISAAKLVDDCGLKGYRIGGAEVSKKHAGFIVNIGNATARDYITLSDHISECVFNKFGISLEREVEVL